MMDLKIRFVYQPTLNTLELKTIKVLIMLLVGNQMEYIVLNFKPLHTAFLHSIKLSGCTMGIKFDKDPLAVERNNYLTKIINVYIVYDLAALPTIPLKNLTLKKLFVWSD